MLQLNDVSKSFGPRSVLRGASFVVNRSQALGVIGPNGSGKSTLLRIAAGQLAPDRGHVDVPVGTRVAYIGQAVEAAEDATARSRFPFALPRGGAGCARGGRRADRRGRP